MTVFNVLVNWIIAVTIASRLIADWYFPNGTQLNFPGDPGNIYEARGTHRADLCRREMATLPTGIYCCIIPFNISIPLERKMLYVGVYNDQEGICSILMYC